MMPDSISPQFVWFILLLIAGCSRAPSRIVPPTVDPTASDKAIEQCDQNGDGVLDDKELSKAPSLKSAMARIDKNGDRNIDAAEIAARFAAWEESKVGLMPVTIRLSIQGKPVTEADVTLLPEPFLGDAFKPARGKSNQHGVAVMQISELPDERGVSSGFYRIEVSKKSNGVETIPAKYNAQTQLGLEVEPASPESRDASFNLVP
jgi:hypothetical protein